GARFGSGQRVLEQPSRRRAAAQAGAAATRHGARRTAGIAPAAAASERSESSRSEPGGGPRRALINADGRHQQTLMLLTSLALALPLAQAAPAPPAPRQSAPQTDETVPVQRGGRLSINNFAGEVIVHTWDKDSLHVVARHQPRTSVRIK